VEPNSYPKSVCFGELKSFGEEKKEGQCGKKLPFPTIETKEPIKAGTYIIFLKKIRWEAKKKKKGLLYVP